MFFLESCLRIEGRKGERGKRKTKREESKEGKKRMEIAFKDKEGPEMMVEWIIGLSTEV